MEEDEEKDEYDDEARVLERKKRMLQRRGKWTGWVKGFEVDMEGVQVEPEGMTARRWAER